MYDPKSPHAEDFINDEEIQATLEWSEANKNNAKLVNSIIEKAKLRKGLNHREALLLLDCDLPEEKERIFQLAKEIKQESKKHLAILNTENEE